MPKDTDDLADPARPPNMRRGEDVVKNEGREPGRHDVEKTGAGRPAGRSEARDATLVNPEDEDPIDPKSPKMPPA
jgi:hypothetical protein